MPFQLFIAGQCYFSKFSYSSNNYTFCLECIKNWKLCHLSWLVLVSVISQNSKIHQIFIYFAQNASIIGNYAILVGQCYFSKFSNSSKIYIFCSEYINDQKLCHFSWLVLVSAISQNSQIHQIFIYFAQNASIIRNYAILVGQCWLVLFLKNLKFIKYLYILLRMHQ